MSEPLTLDLVDRDGAIREAYEEGISRSDVARRALKREVQRNPREVTA